MPTREDVRAALRHFSTYAQYEYFFNKINDPRWIEPLLEEGYLKNPPAVRKVNGFLGFPSWPESRFLARIAHRAPERVADVFRRLPENENVRVAEDIVDAALHMPSEVAATLVPVITKYLSVAYLGMLPVKIAKLVEHLSRSKQALALSLAEVLLLPQQDDRDFNGRRIHQVRAPFEESTYKSIVQMLVPKLTESNGVSALSLFCRLLSRALFLSRLEGVEKHHDLSQNWRPNIDDDTKNYRLDVRNCLVSALRDSALQLAEAGVPVGEVIRCLKSFKWCVFRRVAIFILLRYADEETPRIRRELLSKRNFEDPCIRNEYNALLTLTFPRLRDTAKNKYINYVMVGPDLHRYRRTIKALYGRAPSKKETDAYCKLNMYERLKPIAEDLSPAIAKTYANLARRFRNREEEQSEVGWLRAPSPKSAKEINELTVEELGTLLSEPIRSEDRQGVTPGLVRELASAVRDNPQRYVDNATKFAAIEPVYLSAILNALRQDDSNRSGDDWLSLLRLALSWCESVANASVGDDDNFYFAVREVLETAKAALRADVVSSVHRTILKRLIREMQSIVYRAEDERSSRRDSTNIETLLPLNNVESSYYELCVHYGLWIYRHENKAADLIPNVDRSRQMPEVFDVLSDALANRASSSLYFSIGQHFPYLLYLDTRWTRETIVSAFPRESNIGENAITAWNAYIALNMPNILIFETLRASYKTMTLSLGNNPGKLLDEVFDERLAMHLTYAYAWGRITHDQADLVALFFRCADLGLRRYMLRYIGMEVGRTDSMPEEVTGRFKELWDGRVLFLEKSPRSNWTELTGFSYWFATKSFSAEWTVPRLVDVLRRAKSIDNPDVIMLRLDELTDRFPFDVLGVISLLLQHQQADIDLVTYSPHLSSILIKLLCSSDSEVKRKAHTLVDRLIALGYVQYSGLVET